MPKGLQRKTERNKTMIEVKAITAEDLATHTEVSIEADDITYMAEVTAIIESLMRGLREADVLLHAAVLKVISENPHILLGVKEDSDRAKDFERFVATTKFREGVN